MRWWHRLPAPGALGALGAIVVAACRTASAPAPQPDTATHKPLAAPSPSSLPESVQEATAIEPANGAGASAAPRYRDLLVAAKDPRLHVPAIREALEISCDKRPRTEVVGPWAIAGKTWIAAVCLPHEDSVREEDNEDSPLYLEVGIFEIIDGKPNLAVQIRTSGGGGPAFTNVLHLQDAPVLRPDAPPCVVHVSRYSQPGDHHVAAAVVCGGDRDELVVRLPDASAPGCSTLRQLEDASRAVIVRFDCATGGTGEPAESWEMAADGTISPLPSSPR